MPTFQLVAFLWAMLVGYKPYASCGLPIKTVAAVVSALQDEIHFGCVYLTYSSKEAELLPQSRFLVEFRRGLKSNIQLGLLPDTNQTEFLHKCPTSPLLVVPHTELLLNQSSVLKELLQKWQSNFMWLLLLNDGDTETTLGDIYLEFDSKFFVILQSLNGSVDILEVYRVAKGFPLVTNKFCTWNHNASLACTKESIRSRRKDLMGYELKTGVVEVWPDMYDVGNRTCRGYLCDIWNILSRKINFTYSLQKSTLFGSRSADGSWNGNVGHVARGEVEVGLSVMMITSSRRDVLDFSLPFFSTREYLYIREPEEEDLAWDGFLRPFDGSLCVCTAALVLVAWAVLKLHHRCARGGDSRLGEGPSYSDFLHVIGIFCMQGCESVSRDSARLALLAASTCALVVYTAYCGALTAALATHRPRLPFTDLQGLLRDGSYNLLLLDGSGEMTILAESEDPVTREIYNNMVVKDDLPVDANQAFDRLCSSEKQVLLSHLMDFRLTENSLKCNVTATQEYISTQLAIAFRKRSPYREIINYHLLKLYTEGVVRRLVRRHWPLGALDLRPQLRPPPRRLRPVAPARVAPLLLLLAAAGILSLLLLLAERLCAGVRQHRLCGAATAHPPAVSPARESTGVTRVSVGTQCE